MTVNPLQTTQLSQHFGRVIYLVGPSGAGKDTLINAIRKTSGLNERIFVANRYITRSTSDIGSNENHIEISQQEYSNRVKLNAFALHWQAHDTEYAVGADIDLWLAVGSHVLINGSREHLEQAQKRYPNLIPIWLSVDTATLQQRLNSRGRETEAQIAERIYRNKLLDQKRPDGIAVLENNGDISTTVKELDEILKQQMPQLSSLADEDELSYAQAV